MKIVRVALPVPVPRLFDYLWGNVRPELGQVVQVHFGGRPLWGVVFEHAERSDLPIERLRAITDSDASTSPLPSEWRALVGFAAAYYHQPIGEVAAMALPPRLAREPRPTRDALVKILWIGLWAGCAAS